MVTVTGKLQSAINAAAVKGQVEVMLCGYGSRVPRHNGVALVARLQDDAITIDPAGTFTFTVAPNDEIAPAATYYTVTIKDENGDIAQVNAYRFLSVPGTYDLNLIDPYDPNQPPPPLPPLLSNLLLNLGIAGDNVTFPGDGIYISFKATLTGNVGNAAISNMKPGNLYTFIIVQDGVGGHTFAWPANVHNAVLVDPFANSTTIQTFVADENGALWPVGPATWQ
jgi:hypothetical protein